jgi:hypothetical protein
MLIPSAEVRWFFVGSLQEAVLDAFGGREEAPRCDRYVVLPGVESVGVKLREGMLEVKALQGAVEVAGFPGDVSGRCYCWVKWACAADKLDGLTAMRDGTPQGWVAVEKVRWVTTYSLAPHHADTLRAPTPTYQVELTRLKLGGARWWTLGVEVVGPMDRVRDDLRLAAHAFFESKYPALGLDAALSAQTSWSYPAWLASPGVVPQEE